MNTKILDIVCCPIDQGSLALGSTLIANGAIITEGELICSKCHKRFPIINGIPIFLSEIKEKEASWRDEIYIEMGGETYQALIKHIIKSHYVPTMRREACNFSKRFSKSSFILDLGSGWCFPWKSIMIPNIICIDFSLEALCKAKKMVPEQIDYNIHLICADFLKIPTKNNSLSGIWSSRSIYLHDDNQEAINDLINTLKIKLKNHNLFFAFDNYPYLINFFYKILGKEISKINEFGDFFAKRIAPRDLPASLFTFRGRRRIRYNEILYNHELKLVHNLNLSQLDIFLGKIPFINRGLARQLIFEVYE